MNAHKPNNEKFILDIEGGVPLEIAFQAALAVVKSGRISESRGKKHHCHASRLSLSTGGHVVVAVFPNQKSERFFIYMEEKK